jgi:hypothetical protein
MFRTNDTHGQQSFFDGREWLPDNLRQALADSWADTFYREVFCQIPEELFAPLYSADEASRPNTPVNILMGVEILKSGAGWSDAELMDHVHFDLQVRHALGLDDLRAEIFDVRTLYNFRARVRAYAAETGINLYGKVFAHVTDEQLAKFAVAAGWQRMDSTQVLSNLARWSRLDLLIAVVQQVYAGLPPGEQTEWAEDAGLYLEGRPRQVSYRLPSSETERHLQHLGELLVAWEAALAHTAPDSEALALARRVLREQYAQTPEGLVLRVAEEIPSDSLQSPYDPDATYRVKGGKAYRGGYVVNVSETVAPDNPVQLLSSLAVEQNRTDDGALFAADIAKQRERGIPVQQVTVDGGYNGSTADEACEEHEVTLRPTRLRGGQSSAAHWGWEAYTWEVDEEGQPVCVTCPAGQAVAVVPSRGAERYLARFDRARCAACPYFEAECRVQARVYQPPTLYIGQREVEVARQRQRLRPEDRSVRAAVEATVRSLKRGLRGNKLPVRGLTRARMFLYGAALMVNLRRVHRYEREAAAKAAKNAEQPAETGPTVVFRPVDAIFACLRHIRATFVSFFAPRPKWAFT